MLVKYGLNTEKIGICCSIRFLC